MNSNNFGFSQNNDDDENRDNNNNNNPFGFFSFGNPSFGPGFGGSFNFNADGNAGNAGSTGGGLGDMLSQFGQMLSGMGSSLNTSGSADSQEPVNFSLAENIAKQAISAYQSKHPNNRQEQDTAAVKESVRLAELWLDDATSLPTAGNQVEAWTPETWLDQTLPTWKRLVTPVAEGTSEAELAGLPEELQGEMGPMKNMIGHISRMHQGMNLGNSLGDLAPQTLSGTDFGLPIAPAGVTAVLPQRLAELIKDLDVPVQEAMVYLCAREAARQRLFKHVPWLVELFVSSVEEFAAGLVVDKTEIDEVLRSMDVNPEDPMHIQNLIGRLQESDLTPRITSNNSAAISRLETLLALIEGWVELVVTEAMQERVPSTDTLNKAWQRRRNSGGSADNVLKQVVGIDINAPQVDAAKELWRRVGVAVGTVRRDAVWNHPDFLPTAADVENSAEFIDALLGEGEVEGFDPIAEIDALEKMLAAETETTDKEITDEPTAAEPSGETDEGSEGSTTTAENNEKDEKKEEE